MPTTLLDRPPIVDDATRRQFLTGLAATGLLAGCGSGSGTPVAGPGGSEAFLLTVEHALGTTRIPAPPQRIVALRGRGYRGRARCPAGRSSRYVYQDSGLAPWLSPALADASVELLDVGEGGAPFERIAALRPDVILAATYFSIDNEYERLTGIAPVSAYQGVQLSYGYEQHAFDVGRALGLPDEARLAVQRTTTAIAAARDAYPQLENKTLSYSFHFDTDAIQTINSPRRTSRRGFWANSVCDCRPRCRSSRATPVPVSASNGSVCSTPTSSSWPTPTTPRAPRWRPIPVPEPVGGLAWELRRREPRHRHGAAEPLRALDPVRLGAFGSVAGGGPRRRPEHGGAAVTARGTGARSIPSSRGLCRAGRLGDATPRTHRLNLFDIHPADNEA